MVAVLVDTQHWRAWHSGETSRHLLLDGHVQLLLLFGMVTSCVTAYIALA